MGSPQELNSSFCFISLATLHMHFCKANEASCF